MARETGEGLQHRVFNISPKTPYDGEPPLACGLKDLSFGMGRGGRIAVARDIIENVRELTGNNAVDAAIINFRVTFLGTGHRGAEALEYSVASPLGSLVRELGLGMSSPEAVYMSGYVVVWALNKSYQTASKRVEEIVADRIYFVTPEAKAQDLKKNRDVVGFLGRFKKDLAVSVEEYATQYLPNAKYTEILQRLAFVGGNKQARNMDTAQRNRILALLREGDVDSAYEIFQEVKETVS